jgi:hypothetical protein
MAQYGIFNGNSRNSQYVRDAQNETPKTKTFDLEWYAMRVAARYEVALTLLKSGRDHLVRRGEIMRAECERQLVLLAEFADEEA